MIFHLKKLKLRQNINFICSQHMPVLPRTMTTVEILNKGKVFPWPQAFL